MEAAIDALANGQSVDDGSGVAMPPSSADLSMTARTEDRHRPLYERHSSTALRRWQNEAVGRYAPAGGNGSAICSGSMRPSPRMIFLNSARLTDT